MKKHFFDHLVEIDTLALEVDSLNLEDSQKEEIKRLIDESMYHTILDAILSELSEEDKKKFLSHVVDNDHEKIWELLNEKIDNIEGKIKQAANDLKKELQHDIIS